MKLTFLGTIIALIVALQPSVAAPFNDGFSDQDLDVYLTNAARLYEDASLKEVAGMKGKRCLVLTYDNMVEAEFPAVPVTDQNAYELSFRGQWENGETLDNNPTLEAALDESSPSILDFIPTLTMVFLDAEEKTLNQTRVQAMPYGQWHEYRNVFFPPSGAVSMKLKIKSGSNTGVFSLDDVRFEAVKNPANSVLLDFEVADLKLPGLLYGFPLPRSLQADQSGKIGVYTGYGERSSGIQLLGPGKYRMEFEGEVLRDNGIVKCAVIFLDAAGKTVGEVSSNDLDQKPLEFTLPPDAARIQLRVYNHILRKIEFVKLKDENPPLDSPPTKF